MAKKLLLAVPVILLVLFISGCTQLSQLGSMIQNKPSYFCDSSNSTCMAQTNEDLTQCNNVIATTDTQYYTYVSDITKMDDTCRVVQTVTKYTLPDVAGKSMVCDVPVSKMGEFRGVGTLNVLKYCEGELKNKLVSMMGGFSLG